MLHGAVEIHSPFLMDQERIRAGVGKGLQVQVGIFNHQMNFERQAADGPKGLDHRWTNRDIGDEMAVHDVDMDPIGARLLGCGHLLSQPRKIGRQNGWSDLDFCASHRWLQLVVRHGW